MGEKVPAGRKVQFVVLSLLALTVTALPAEGRGGRRTPVRPPRGTSAIPPGIRVQGFNSVEEKRFVTAMANRINRETVEALASPDTRYTPGSLRARIQQKFLKMDASVRAEMVKNARRIRALPAQERKRFYVPRSQVAARRGQRFVRGRAPRASTLKQDLATAIHKRLDATLLRSKKLTVRDIKRKGIGTKQKTKTTVEIGWFAGEVQSEGRNEVTINSTTSIDARWATTEGKAEEGAWVLTRLEKNLPAVVVAEGIAGPAPGGVFTIDLTKHLRAKPPETRITYLLRVTPRTKAKMVKTPGATPGSSTVNKVPAKRVGWPSLPARIHYEKATGPGPSIADAHVYRKAEYVLESMRMVTDSTEIGAEEFHVMGFVREMRGTEGAGSQQKLSRWLKTIDGDDRKKHKLNRRRTFALNHHAGDWPRAYISVISILEEDAGGGIEEWQNSIWDIADHLMSTDFADEVKKAVASWFQEHAEEIAAGGIDVASHIADIIAMALNASAATVVGMVVAVATMVVLAIISAMEDDYYGTQVVTWWLPVNDTELVKDPERWRNDALDLLPPGAENGSALPDGGWRWGTVETMFYGQASYPSASAYDGKVAIYQHLEFKDPVPRH